MVDELSRHLGKLLQKCLIKPLTLAAELLYVDIKRTDMQADITLLIIRSPNILSDFNCREIFGNSQTTSVYALH
jgi:hypothetical protein